MPRLSRLGLAAAAVTTLALASCGPATTSSGSGGIPQGEYVLVGMDGGTVPLRNVTLVVGDNQLSGRGPCNSYSVTNNASMPALQLSPINSTKMHCKDAPLENRFFATLQSATEMEFFGGVLKVKSPRTWLIFEHGRRATEPQVDALEAARAAQ